MSSPSTSHRATVGGCAWMTGPRLVLGVLDEFVARRDAAGPALAFVVEAKLVDRGRVDAAKTNSIGSDHDGIALADLRRAADICGLRERGQQKRNHREQEFQTHAKRPVQK